MNQIIQLSGKFLYRISRVWFTSKTTEPIVIEELEEALPRQMVEEQDADTPAAFYTATPGYSSSYQTPGRLNPDTNFGKALTQQKLVEAKEVEVNWSGRGQHVEFRPDDKIPLQLERAIGHSATAIVESVRCRRIRLARKSIRCRHGVKLKYLIREVSYLHRLRHPHIIQLVGTYLQKNTFAILLYPVATGDLTKFMDEWQLQYSQQNGTSSSATYYQLDLARFFFCLTSAVAFMHEKGIRHMDIKPSNILVHERRSFGKRTMRSVYLTDFGISRAFTQEDGSQTDGPTPMTKRWCSPEVASQVSRGRSSDVFSLGCVFSEMYTTLMCESRDSFERFREQGDGVDAFHLKLSRVRQWLNQLDRRSYAVEGINPFEEQEQSEFVKLLIEMISKDPLQRPTSGSLMSRLKEVTIYGMGKRYTWFESMWGGQCCSEAVETYRVAEEDEIFEAFQFDEYINDHKD